MFTDKLHINTLVALLLESGVEHIVACPGSRNAPIIHDCHEAGLQLHPVTDERSAGFVAIGLSLSLDLRPVAVCVTSGSALLNLLPAVSEAYYRQIPMLVISADRPAEWIGHLDGQTIPQVGALQPYSPTYVIDEEHPSRAVLGQAFRALWREGRRPVHINVHIAEPLFRLTNTVLPQSDPDDRPFPKSEVLPETLPDAIVQLLQAARHPVLAIGAYDSGDLRDIIQQIAKAGVRVYADINSQINDGGRMALFELRRETEIDTDLIIHVGGAFVGKYLKLALRRAAMAHHIPVIRIDATDEAPNTFRGVLHKVTMPPYAGLALVPKYLHPQPHETLQLPEGWGTKPLPDTKAETFRRLSVAISTHAESEDVAVFLANSTAPRAVSASGALRPGRNPIYINRGVNGIEGCISVAAGYSLGSLRKTIMVTGDLSFFYDANALWNKQLRGNLRVIVVNDQCGGIFAGLPSFGKSPALHDYIAASHNATAEGIAASYGCGYVRADGCPDVEMLHQWLAASAERPQIFEIFIARNEIF